VGNQFFDEVSTMERYLNLPKGSLRNIPEYALDDAVYAISRVKEMESTSLFRPGLYYIVLVDLVGNTKFNAQYGDAAGDLRIEWFQTCVIESIGNIEPRNYIAFSKTIGDAALLIFSSFLDVYDWSNKLTANLLRMSNEYEFLMVGNKRRPGKEKVEQAKHFALRARRLVHLGEVAFKENIDPLSLAVSATFKIEKSFSDVDLGCTQAVADAIAPKLGELNLRLDENVPVAIPGMVESSMTYYIRQKDVKSKSAWKKTASKASKKK
jgi:hypothetical protein